MAIYKEGQERSGGLQEADGVPHPVLLHIARADSIWTTNAVNDPYTGNYYKSKFMMEEQGPALRTGTSEANGSCYAQTKYSSWASSTGTCSESKGVPLRGRTPVAGAAGAVSAPAGRFADPDQPRLCPRGHGDHRIPDLCQRPRVLPEVRGRHVPRAGCTPSSARRSSA